MSCRTFETESLPKLDVFWVAAVALPLFPPFLNLPQSPQHPTALAPLSPAKPLFLKTSKSGTAAAMPPLQAEATFSA